MKKRFQNIFTRVRKKNGMPVLLFAVALTLFAGTLLGFGVNGARAAVTGTKERVTASPAHIRTFGAEDVSVFPAVGLYEF